MLVRMFEVVGELPYEGLRVYFKCTFLQTSAATSLYLARVVAIRLEPMFYAVADSYKRPILVCGLLWKPVFNFNLNLIDACCGIPRVHDSIIFVPLITGALLG